MPEADIFRYCDCSPTIPGATRLDEELRSRQAASVSTGAYTPKASAVIHFGAGKLTERGYN